MGYVNIYSSPEAFGLEVFGELEDPEACYSFDTLVVWKQKDTGKLFYADDAGCSCPTPFEDHDISTIKPVISATWNEFFEAVTKHCLREWRDDPEDQSFKADKTQLLSKVHSYLAETGQ